MRTDFLGLNLVIEFKNPSGKGNGLGQASGDLCRGRARYITIPKQVECYNA